MFFHPRPLYLISATTWWPFLLVHLLASSAYGPCIQDGSRFKGSRSDTVFHLIPQWLKQFMHPKIRLVETSPDFTKTPNNFVNAIVVSLIKEVHGYHNVERVQAANVADTVGIVARGDADLSLEVWPASLADVLSEGLSQKTVVDLGKIGYHSENGIYVRPSTAERSEVMEYRWYKHFFTDLKNWRVLSADEILKYCDHQETYTFNGEMGIVCGDDGIIQEVIGNKPADTKGIRVGHKIVYVDADLFSKERLRSAENSGSYYVVTTVRHATCDKWAAKGTCTGVSECPGIAVPTGVSKLDNQRMREMLTNSSIEASLVYLEQSSIFRMLYHSNATILVQGWFPEYRLHDFNIYPIRIDFEYPRVCDYESIAHRMNNITEFSCDFYEEQLRKVASANFVKTYADIKYFIEHMSLVEGDVFANSGWVDHTITVDDMACRWIQEHESEWREWVRESKSLGYGHTSSKRWIFFFLTTLVFLFLWLCAPLCRTDPYTDADPNYYGPAEFWFYTAMWPGFFTSLLNWSRERLKTFRTTELMNELPKQLDLSKRASDWCFERRNSEVELTLLSMYQSCNSQDISCNFQDIEGFKHIPTLSDADVSIADRLRIATVQGHWRGGDAGAQVAVAREVGWLTEGVQFTQTIYYGLAGDEKFKVCIVRGAGWLADRSVRVDLECTDVSATEGIDYQLCRSHVYLPPGKQFVEVGVKLLEAEHRMSLSSPWMPMRSFALKLVAFDEATRVPMRLGSCASCEVVVIETQEWPCPGASGLDSFALMRTQAYEIVKGNRKRELWWFVGMLWRAVTTEVVDPLLLKYLVDDVLEYFSLRFAFILASIKLFCSLCDHYSSFWFSVQGPICWVKPWAWLFAKWGALPWEQSRNAETQEKFMGFAERIDVEYTSSTYKAEIGAVEYVIKLALALLSFYLVSEKTIIAVGMNLLVIPIGILIYCRHRSEAGRYATAHQGEWSAHAKFLVQRTFLFENAELMNYRTADRDWNIVMATRKKRTVRRDEQWYTSKTQGAYISWIMLVPWICCYSMSPLLVDFKVVSKGSLVVLMLQLLKAGTKLNDFGSYSFKLVTAWTAIKAFANILNQDTDKIMALARCTAEVREEHLRQVARSGSPCLKEIRFVNCVASSKALCEACGDGFSFKCNGGVPAGGIYGLADTRGGDIGIQNRILLDLVGGLRIPSEGAVLLPPGARALVVNSDTSAVPIQLTVIDNLCYGLNERGSRSESRIWSLCQALGMDSRIFSTRCGHLPLAELSWMIEPLDRVMMNLVRALVCMPEILVLHALGDMSPRRRRMLEIILRNFVEGVPFCDLILFRKSGAVLSNTAGKSCPSVKRITKHAPYRTVFMMADQDTLTIAEKRLCINRFDGKVQVES